MIFTCTEVTCCCTFKSIKSLDTPDKPQDLVDTENGLGFSLARNTAIYRLLWHVNM